MVALVVKGKKIVPRCRSIPSSYRKGNIIEKWFREMDRVNWYIRS